MGNVSSIDLVSSREKERAAFMAAKRQAAYRKRHGVKPFTVNLPVDLLAEFDSYLKFKNYTRSAVVEKLIRTQLLRKR